MILPVCRLWHRLFGHPQLLFAGWRKREAHGAEPTLPDDPFASPVGMYQCSQCRGWVEIQQTGHRHIRIVERTL